MSNIGRMIYGFCGGMLGDELSTDWSPKRIEAEGDDWIVARGERGEPQFATFTDREEKQQLVDAWAQPEGTA